MELHLTHNALGSEAVRHTVTATDSTVNIQADAHIRAEVYLDIGVDVTESAIHCTAGEGAEVTLLCVQPAEASGEQRISQRNAVGSNGRLHCQNVTLGAQVEHAIVTELQGEQAHSSVDWVAYAHNKERHALTANNVFQAPRGGGEILIKSVAENHARIDCNGLIDIGLKGGGTDTYLTEDVLMLDPTCVVDAIPGLEIKTNDVKASHSAVVSRVTNEDLFYFQARGIAQKEAREMYVLGFLGDVLQRLPSAELRDNIIEAVTQKYHALR